MCPEKIISKGQAGDVKAWASFRATVENVQGSKSVFVSNINTEEGPLVLIDNNPDTEARYVHMGQAVKLICGRKTFEELQEAEIISH